MTFEDQIIQVSSYQLTDTAESFTTAIQALSKRTQEEGPEDILRYSFYVNPEEGTAGAVIVYRDLEAWLDQHDFAAPLEEYQDFYKTFRLTGLRFFGNLTLEIRQSLDERGLSYEYVGQLAAGFER